MNKGLQTYLTNKLISLGSMALLIIGSILFLGYTTTQWQVVLLFLIIFGYGHFLVGFYYQLMSFKKKPKPLRYFLTFIFFAIISVILSQMLFLHAGYGLALFIGFMYFLLHGLFNEQTLIKRQSGITVPLVYLGSIAVFVMSLLMYTIPDPTFFFSRTLEFIPVDTVAMAQLFHELGFSISSFKQIFWSGVALSFALLLYSWIKYRLNTLALFFAGTLTLVILTTVFIGALPYIYMYLIVVGYHFMTWFLFYWTEMKMRSQKMLNTFIGLHILVLLPFIFAGVLFFGSPIVPDWALTLLDYKYFVIATYVHITVSFMNDTWCQNLIDRVFNYFA